MFDEKDFKDAYKSAYDTLTPDEDKVKQLKGSCLEKKHTGAWHRCRPAVAVCGILLMLTLTSNSALAGIGNFAYEKISELAPGLADYILPVKLADTKQGITMQVEAMQVEGNTGELVVSFADEEGSGKDLISGKVDLYDSYHLKSYGSDSNIGGCSFIEYDEETDKVYFKITVSTEDEFDKGRLKFSVRQLLLENRDSEAWLDSIGVLMNPPLKECTLNGKGGSAQVLESITDYFYKTEESFPLFVSKVMDIAVLGEDLKDTIQVTGVGYTDGILRVQICRGTLEDAVRHAEIYMVDEEGNYRHHDYMVSWHEELDGENITFDEQWFMISEDELENLQLYAVMHETDGSLKGNWQVTVNLANK
ncbi:MAG: hypothetical protein IJZ82_00675 [Lachnospiraceae bacterium]|nr:hypothetical protein [Lachnospiraceae bacterium]